MTTFDEDDWRLSGQEKYLNDAVLEFREYSPPSKEWDHDHCEFCWSKFCQSDASKCIGQGYVTDDGMNWICQDCFRDFRERFRFSLKET